MKAETIQLSETLDEGSAMHIARVLSAVNGVKKVSVATVNRSVDIDFDGDATSLQELRAALQQAGVGVKKSAHGEEGMCCGSCGT
jgi:copper chaperone CopZ